MAGARHHVVLVPGFFGFGNFGDLRYFVGVADALRRGFQAHAVDLEIVEVATLPTASIRHRAARVRETVAALDGRGDVVHLVGHSTGGLDVRLATAPVATLPTEAVIRPDRIGAIVTVSTPHRGTPLADLLGSAFGRPILSVGASLAYRAFKRERIPVRAALRLGAMFSRFDDWLVQRDTVLDQLYRDLLADFSEERRGAISDWIEAIASDQSLVFQLTAAGCDVLNACTAEPDVPHGSVITRAPAPTVRSLLRRDLYAAGSHFVYALLYGLAARSTAADVGAREQGSLAGHLAPSHNDGIVPSRSQIWGQVVALVEADHLDVVGHYGSAGGRDALAEADWLPSGAGFDDRAFDRLWSDVATFLVDASSHSQRRPGPRA